MLPVTTASNKPIGICAGSSIDAVVCDAVAAQSACFTLAVLRFLLSCATFASTTGSTSSVSTRRCAVERRETPPIAINILLSSQSVDAIDRNCDAMLWLLDL